MPRPRHRGPTRPALRDRVDAYGDEDAALPFRDGATVREVVEALEGDPIDVATWPPNSMSNYA